MISLPPLLVSLLLLLLSLASASDDGPDAPPDFSFGSDKPCPNFRCSAGHSPVQKSRSKFVSLGCSKMGGGGMLAMSAGSGNEKYAVCCDRWFACYQTCGAAKSTCDAGFKSCYTEVCAGDEKCTQGASLNNMMLGLGGCQGYDQSQFGACECVKKEKVEEKRASALRAFYKKFAPGQVDKTDALAKKVDSSSKMAALFRKLHIKYPDSIKVEIDDEMSRMQEMLNKANTVKDDRDVDSLGDDDETGDGGETEEL